MDYLEDVEGLAPDNVVTEFQNHFHHAIPSLEDNDESVAMAFDVLGEYEYYNFFYQEIKFIVRL